MDFIKYTFLEDEWVIYLIEEDDDTITESGAVAQVFFDKKEIYFRPDGVNLNVVLHELFHVYVGYCYLSDADLDMNQFEEITCSLFADKAESIIIKGKELLKQLKKLRDNHAEEKK